MNVACVDASFFSELTLSGGEPQGVQCMCGARCMQIRRLKTMSK